MATIEALKCFKSEKSTNYISEVDRMQMENCLSENPEFSAPEDISLLSDIPLEVVTSYLQNRPLNDEQKADIKEKVDIGNSVQEIAILLRLSPKKVQEYVDDLRNRPLDDKQKTNGQKNHSHGPDVSDNDLNIWASNLSKEESTLANSPCVSDSSSMIPHETNIKFLEKGEENLLQGKLLSLNLSREDIHFILEQGEKFLERPHLLSTKLKIDLDTTKASIEALKCFKFEKPTNHISEHDRMLVEDCLRENPQYSTPEDIFLLTDVPLQMVASYLQDRPLDDKQKTDIKKKVDTGTSIHDISVNLGITLIKAREYVESTFLTFTCEEGRKCLQIILKTFGDFSTFELRRLVISNNLKLQDKLCCILLKRNKEDYNQLKKYFAKFEESSSFFKINTELTIEDIDLINQSSDIENLSIQLRIVESVIRDYLEQYHPNKTVEVYCKTNQRYLIKQFLADYRSTPLSFHSYRMIVTHSFKEIIRDANANRNQEQKFNCLLPLAFYYLKCSLPLEDITQMLSDSGDKTLTTHDLFHIIFQLSDPVLRGFCIEHYSFSNPVPFYYPDLHSTNLNQNHVEFAICSELWYSIQQYNGLISFGLGRAGWNPIGKSHLLDLIFETDFVRGNPQKSAFHFNSIDIQMTNNLFGETQRHADESIKWAFIDCNGHSNKEVIKLICQQLSIALIQVSYQDYQNSKALLRKDIYDITNSVEHVYLFIRDYGGNTAKIEIENRKTKDATIQYIFIPNLTKHDTNINSVNASLKRLGYEMLHLKYQNIKTIGSEFIEKVMEKMCPRNVKEIRVEKLLIQTITDFISTSAKSSQKIEFSFLQYYPLFVEYMSCYHKAYYETDQFILDELNFKFAKLDKELRKTQLGEVVKYFNDIIKRDNSTLIMWKLSQKLTLVSNDIILKNRNTSMSELREQSNDKYSLEILWREALLSHKYCKLSDESKGEFLRSFASSFSNHVQRGEPFELIDGDNLRYFNQEINRLLYDMYSRRFTELESSLELQGLKLKPAPIVVSIFGPQSSGKSTLLNYCFGCKFLTSAGRCTRGIYASLAKLSRPVNGSDQFLILDTEGLDAIERGHIKDTSLIYFDRTMVLFCLAVSQVVIINVRGDIGSEMQNLLQICAYSLNKLRVKKVTAPQIFFVLNQQADPDPDKHLDCINILMDKLNNELIDAEGSKVSDLIKVSRENLFVLPSAFNSEQINKPNLNLFDSKVIKLSPTIAFADRCADLRMAIIEKLEKVSIDERTSFDTMSEWMEMSGNIWDTIIKYQDIVKYRNFEEMICSDLLRKIISELIESHITDHRQEYIENTEQLSAEIRNINILYNPDDILTDVMLRFHDSFRQHKQDCLAEYKNRCQNDMLLKAKQVLCGEHELNLTRLIYMEKKIHEDKIKFQITAIQIEKKIENMKKFQEAIIKNVDSYLGLNIENQTLAFEKTWAICFADENENVQKAELNESFENLYSLFQLECKAMANKNDIKERFLKEGFQIGTIIDNVKTEILHEFLLESRKQAFIFPCIEHNIPLKDMTPFTGNKSYQYLPHDKLYKTQTDIFLRTKLILPSWIPKECTPLIKYCSGYYNLPDIQWKAWHIQKQILCLASNLRSPRDNDKSSWEVLIDDISVIKTFAEEDPNVSPATVKKMVNHLCHLINVVNYELSFIQAKLSVTAERKLSTLVFTYAFKSLWETKTKKRQVHLKTEKEKQSLLEYFLRKIEIRKKVRGGWDREEMKKNDRDTSHKFALDFLGSVKRGVVTEEHSVIEYLFNEQNTKLSHQNLLLLANSMMLRNLKDNPEEEIMYENNFVVQFICNRNEELRELFTTQWNHVQTNLYFKIKKVMKIKFNKKLAPIKEILKTLLADLVKSHNKAEISEHKAFDSDSNFEIVDMVACDIDSEIKLKESPFRAMMLYLQAYLDPNIPSEEFNELFRNEFEVDGIKMRISDTYKLCNKPFNLKVLNEETFQKLNYIKMFSFENIFNIFDFVTQFLHVIDSNSFELTEKDFEDIVQPIKENFERDAIGCPNQCPSCGKICERELHPNDGLCQIKTGHQICSMGGKVWNNDEDKTAVLHMCDDYQNYTNVIIQGRPSTWKHFQDSTQDQWDWTMPQDEEYVALQKNNRKFMKDIWNKFGKGILNYYSTRGTDISFVPYTSSEELCKALKVNEAVLQIFIRT